MAKVQKTVITALGEQMLFSSALTYTNATLCSQDISNLTIDQLRSLTDLTGKVLSSPISAHKRQGNTKADQVDVQVTFTNQDQKADINYSSIGWFARDHQGQETLIAVTPFIGTDTIAAAPPDGTATSSKNITLSMAAGTATEINVLIDPAGSVTPSTFNAEVDKINEALALKADNAELADYAKKADVNSALDAKADKTALDPLAKSEDVAKDVETLNSAINLKADKTDLAPLAKTEDVNTELDKKADKTALDDYAKSNDVAADVKQLTDSIATKVDAKTVDDAIDKIDFSSYAKTADVQAELDTKANTTDLAPFAKTADVSKQIEDVSTAVTNASNTEQANISKINKALAAKRDIADSYSKDELDKKFLQLSTDTGGKVGASQVAAMIANKADKSDVDAKIKTVTDLANTKADASDTYNKKAVDDAFSQRDSKITNAQNTATQASQKADDNFNKRPVINGAAGDDLFAYKSNQLRLYPGNGQNCKNLPPAINTQWYTVEYIFETPNNDGVAIYRSPLPEIWAVGNNGGTFGTWHKLANDDDFNNLKNQINTKANSSDVYVRKDVDNAFSEVRDRIGKLEGSQTVDSPDFNNLTASGVYYITNNGANIKNNPVSQWGVLIVSNGDGHRISQVYYPDDGNPPWYRSLDESTWRNWIQLSTKQDVNNATNLANAASNKVDTVLANSYVRKQGMNANGDCVEIKHTGIKQANGGYAFDMWSDDWTASRLQDVIKNQLPNKANTSDVNTALSGKANVGDATALQGKVNVNTPLFREISADSTWEDIFGVTNPTNVLTSLRINPGGNGQLVNDFAAGIGFGGNDTKAVISVDCGSHLAKITGGNGTAPSWSEDIAWKSDISSLTQALTKLQAAFDAQQTKIAALQTTVNNQANQLTYFKQHYIEGKAFDADQIKQAMAWTGDDGQKLAIIRDKENEGGK